MDQMPQPYRLYRADVSEEFGGGEVNFSHYLMFFPNGTLRCCLKQDFAFPSGQYQDPAYMKELLEADTPKALCEEEILSGIYTNCESGCSFSVFCHEHITEAGTITIRENILFAHIHTTDVPKGILREYTPC